MAIDLGSTITIEVEFKKRTPFSTTWEYYDPTSPTVTVTDPVGTERVAGQAATRSTTGKYYYIVQSGATWMPGSYSVTAEGVDGAYSEIDVTPGVFELE